MTVASMLTLRARITLVNISSQMVQVLGFILLGRMPNARNGSESTPRNGTGMCMLLPAPNADLGLVRGHGSASAGKDGLSARSDLRVSVPRQIPSPCGLDIRTHRLSKAKPRRAFMAPIRALAAAVGLSGATRAAASAQWRFQEAVIDTPCLAHQVRDRLRSPTMTLLFPAKFQQ